MHYSHNYPRYRSHIYWPYYDYYHRHKEYDKYYDWWYDYDYSPYYYRPYDGL